MQSLCESDNTQAGSESSEGSKSFYLDFFFSSFRDNRNIISGDQQKRTIRSLYGFYSSKVDRFEMKILNVDLRNFRKCTVFADISQGLRIRTQLSYEVCFTSMCKWLIKRRLNSTEVIPHVEICYRILLPN